MWWMGLCVCMLASGRFVLFSVLVFRELGQIFKEMNETNEHKK